MPVAHGVLTIAHGYPRYAEYAVDLARSIRLRDRDVPLAVATNLSPDLFHGLYDVIIPWDFRKTRGLSSKLDMYDASPFETTLFIDADCFVLRSLEPVFRYFDGVDFGVYGRMDRREEWWWINHGPASVRAAMPTVADYPVFNGGVYFFRKSPTAEFVFGRAREWREEYVAAGIIKPGGSMPEEPLICLAMTEAGLTTLDAEPLHVMVVPETATRWFHIDVVRGESTFRERGRRVRPEIVHFAIPWKDAYLQLRESRRVALAYANGKLTWRDEAVARLGALREWLGYRKHSAVQSVRRRFGRGAGR